MNLVSLNTKEDKISPLADPLRKTTIIGDLPKDWEVGAIGHSNPFVTSGSRGWARYYSDAGAPFIRIGNLSHDCVDVNLGDLQYVELDSAASAEATRTRLHRGDLLISITADIGAIGFVHDQIPLPAYINQHIALVRFDPAAVHSKFAAYVLSSQPVQRIFKASMDLGAKAGMSLTTVRKILLPLPPVPEQEAIAETLSDVDGLIGALETLIAKKRATKQAVMQQLLTGKTRLPGFTGKWITRRIEELAAVDPENLSGSTDPSYTFNYISLEHIDAGRILGFSEEAFRSAPSRARRVLRHNDVLMSTVRPNLMAHFHFRSQVSNAVCSTGFAVLRARSGVADPRFLFAHLFGHDVNQQIEKTLAGSNYPAINGRDVRVLDVSCPPTVEEQSAIASILADMNAEIEALECRRDKTRQIKQGMMQQLLTGRIRLVKPDDEKQVTQTSARQANVHFIRSVLAAEIIDQLHEQPTFGHVKFEKIMFLVEHLCGVETGSTYHRKAAGPYDNRALRSIDSQLRAQQWFDARVEGKRYLYIPMQKRGGHKRYFNRYFSELGAAFDRILEAFKMLDTERCEIVATLLSAWNDLLLERGAVSDESIVHEVLNNWHEAKRRIPEDRWLEALGWMRSQGFVPKGAT